MTVDGFKVLKVSKKMHLRIKMFSVERDRKMHEVVNDACNEYLKKEVISEGKEVNMFSSDRKAL